jgi:hypothetical protein
MTKVTRPPGVPAIDHFNIDDSAWIHELVIEEVDRALDSTNSSHFVRRRSISPLEPRVWRESQ